MAPPQAVPLILCQMALLFKSPTYAFLAVAILAKGHRRDFNNGPEVTQIMAAVCPRRLFQSDSNYGHILAPSVYSSLKQIMAPPLAIPVLNYKHELAQKLF